MPIKNKIVRVKSGLQYGSSAFELNAHVFNYDINNAEIIFQIVDGDNEPISLVNATSISLPLAFIIDNNKFNPDDIINANGISMGKIINGAEGLFSWRIPTERLNHTGDIFGEIAINFADGTSLVPTQFRMASAKALITKPLPPSAVAFFIETFDELRTHVTNVTNDTVATLTEKTDAVAERQGEVERRMTANEVRLDEHEKNMTAAGHVFQGEFHELYQRVLGMASVEHVMDSSWTTISASDTGNLIDRLLQGRTLVNLYGEHGIQNPGHFVSLNANTISYHATTTPVQQDSGGSFTFRDLTMLKPNTTYTIVIDVETDGNVFPLFSWNTQATATSYGSPFAPIWTSVGQVSTGQTVITRTTNAFQERWSQINALFRNSGLVQGARASITVSIFEGDLRNLTLNHTPPRDFASPQNLVVTSMGENLFDGEFESGAINNNGQNVSWSGNLRSVNYIPVRGGRELFVDNSGGIGVVWHQYDENYNHIGRSPDTTISFTTDPRTRYVRFWRGEVGFPRGITYDERRPFTQHQSQTQPLYYQADNGEWLPVPELKGIMVDGELLVADEVTETEYIQRVQEVDIETVGIGGISHLENVTRIPIQAGASGTSRQLSSNRLPNVGFWEDDFVGVHLSGAGNVSARVPLNPLIINAATARQYLIDNNYRFIVPLAQPRRFKIRPWGLDSYEPVTNVHVNSGAVSPRFSFKIATSIGQRLSLLTQQVAEIERKIWDKITGLEAQVVSKEQLEIDLANLSADIQELLKVQDLATQEVLKLNVEEFKKRDKVKTKEINRLKTVDQKFYERLEDIKEQQYRLDLENELITKVQSVHDESIIELEKENKVLRKTLEKLCAELGVEFENEVD